MASVNKVILLGNLGRDPEAPGVVLCGLTGGLRETLQAQSH